MPLNLFLFRNSTLTSSPQNIAVNIDDCNNHCTEFCDTPVCDLCLPCLRDDNYENIFHQSYREHQRRGEFKRVFPSIRFKRESEEFKTEMSEKTQILSLWYEGKCKMDRDWCH